MLNFSSFSILVLDAQFEILKALRDGLNFLNLRNEFAQNLDPKS